MACLFLFQEILYMKFDTNWNIHNFLDASFLFNNFSIHSGHIF